MAAYTNDLRLKEIATGDESGTWGDSTNTNLELIAEAFSFGTEAITTNADTHATTIADGSTDEGRSIYLKYTGTLDSACTITLGPNTVSKLWFIENATSGSQNIIISQGSGANVTIPNGHVKAVYSDGAGSGAAIVDAFTDLNLAGTTTIDVLSASGNATIGGTLGVTGAVTADAGVSIDNITIDGTEIDLSSGDLTVDVAGVINLDADGAEVAFKDGGTHIGSIINNSSDFVFRSIVQDKDVLIRGNDGGSAITALQLDMSEAGAATFNSTVNASGSIDAASSSSVSTVSATASGSANMVLGTNFSGSASQGMPNQSGFINMRQSFPMVFGVAETEHLRIDTNGNFSFGGGGNATNFSGYVTLDLRDTTGGLIDFSEASAGVFARLQGIVNNSLQITNRQAYPIIFNTNDTERMRIASDGNVGIGTSDTGNAKLVFNGAISEGADTAMIDFDGFGTRGNASSQSINFRMGRTGFATDQPAQIKSFFSGGGATAAATNIGFKFTTIVANSQHDALFIDASHSRFKFNTDESPQSNNPQTNNCFVIGPSTSTAVTQSLTNACVLINRGGELFAVDSSHNNTQITPHNWNLISEGPSEELAWTYWSERPNPSNPDQLQGINVDMAKVVRKVEDLVGEKLIYTENSNMDDHTHQTIISDIQATLADLKTRVENLEG